MKKYFPLTNSDDFCLILLKYAIALLSDDYEKAVIYINNILSNIESFFNFFNTQIFEFNTINLDLKIEVIIVELLNNRGMCHMKLGKNNQALEDFNIALSYQNMNEFHSIVYLNRGAYFYVKKDIYKANEDFQRGLYLLTEYEKKISYIQDILQKNFDQLKSINEDTYEVSIFLELIKKIHNQKNYFLSNEILSFYTIHFDAPLLIYNLIQKKSISANYISTDFYNFLNETLSKSEPFLIYKMFNESQTEKKGINTLLSYFLGSYGDAFDIFEQIDKNEELSVTENYFYAKVVETIGVITNDNIENIYKDSVYLSINGQTDIYYLALSLRKLGYNQEAFYLFDQCNNYLPALYQKVILLNEKQEKDLQIEIIEKIIAKESKLQSNEGFLNDFNRVITPQSINNLQVLIDYAHYIEIEEAIKIIKGRYEPKTLYDSIQILHLDSMLEVLRINKIKSINAEIIANYSKQINHSNSEELKKKIIERFDYHRDATTLFNYSIQNQEKLEYFLASFIYLWDYKDNVDFYETITTLFFIEKKIDEKTFVILRFYILRIKNIEGINSKSKDINKDIILDTCKTIIKEIIKNNILYLVGYALLSAIVSYFAGNGLEKLRKGIISVKIKQPNEDYQFFKQVFENDMSEIVSKHNMSLSK